VRRQLVLLALAVAVARPLAGQQRGWEVTIGGVSMPSGRAVDFEGHRHTATGTGLGAEVQVGRGPFSLWGRAVATDFGAAADTAIIAAATVGDIDVRGRFRVRQFSLEGGVVRRVVTGQFAAQTWQGLRFGGRLHLRAGEGALHFEGAVGYSPTLRSAGAGTTGTGIDFEWALRFAPVRAPLWFSVGYRVERRDLPGLTGKQFERVSAIVAAGGLALHGGGRPQ
jgi:hypothetical protein